MKKIDICDLNDIYNSLVDYLKIKFDFKITN